MSDLLAYLPVLIALMVAVLGVLFGKTGERNQLSRISYLFISLAVLTAAYGSYDIWRKARAKAISDRTADDQRKAATVELKAARTARDKAEDQYAQTRRVLEMSSFDLNRPFTYGIFYFDFDLTENGPVLPKGFTGPFPTFGRAGMRGEVELKIDGVFDYLFTVSSGPGGIVTIKREGSEPQVFSVSQLHCYTSTKGICQDPGKTVPKGDWWAELVAPSYTHGVMLDSKVSLAKLTSRALDADPYGTMTYRVPGLTRAEYDEIVKGLPALHPDLKLYAPMHAQLSDCENSNIHLPVSLHVSQRSSPKEIVLDLVPGRARFDTVECEDAP